MQEFDAGKLLDLSTVIRTISSEIPRDPIKIQAEDYDLFELIVLYVKRKWGEQPPRAFYVGQGPCSTVKVCTPT
jgi:hypothetical protein